MKEYALVPQEEGGINCHHYHAGIPAKLKIEVQNKWRSGQIQVLVGVLAIFICIDSDLQCYGVWTIALGTS